MDPADEEKMRRRRERAAAWAAGKSDSNLQIGGVPETSSSVKSLGVRSGTGEASSNTSSEEAPRNWSGWAQHVSGEAPGGYGWKHTVGGLQAVSEVYGRHNSAALKQVANDSSMVPIRNMNAVIYDNILYPSNLPICNL
jgi:hypothetical protein